MKSITLLLLCLSLTACANFPLFSDSSWMKNPFADSSQDDSRQRGERIAAEPSNPTHWFCYPSDSNTDWQCQHQRKPGQINESSDQPTLVAGISAVQTSQVAETIPGDTQITTEAVPGGSLAMADRAPASADQQAVPDYTPPPEPPVLTERTDIEIEATTNPEILMSGTSLAADTQKILELPAGYFAVQLIALDDLAELQAYASAKAIAEPLIVRITAANQQRLMVLLEGVYAEQDLASAAAEAWAAANPDSEKPWVRKLSTLQNAMREAARDE